MASMTITGIDDSLKKQLRIQAAQHGCSMEEEAREILRCSLFKEHTQADCSMFDTIREIVAPLGGIDLEIPPREPIRHPPDFS